VTTPSRWGQKLEHLSQNEQDTLLGTSLSRRFTALPLWLSHPGNIGAFYGILISLALLMPYRFSGQDTSAWLANWLFHTSLLIVGCLMLGFASLLLVRWSKRFPMAPPRIVLYPMPFVGLALLTLSRTDMLNAPLSLVWLLLLLPGPLYVHLSWAPRWRLLCMLEDGKNPFLGLESKGSEPNEDAATLAGDDEELRSVVEEYAEE
tara:strand:+ start:1642 stop:2256 length:615 start_codon:yes stop_codon:yes gene_type:complete